MTPTPEQLAIVEAATDTSDNLIVSALAGAAKTSTLVMIAKALPKTSMLCLAFNRRIAVEMQDRLPSTCVAMTLNSLGHRVWAQTIGKRLVVNTRKNYGILSELVEKLSANEKEEAYATFADTLRAIEQGKSAGYIPTGKFPNAKRLLDDDEFFASLEEEPSKLQEELLRAATFESIKQGFQGTIDFSDQILLPTVFPASFPQYPLVLIDEAQDLSELNHATLRKLARKRLIAVGDECQCQPSGTIVQTPKGHTTIENLKPGDEVLSYHRDKNHIRGRKVLDVAARSYIGDLISIITEKTSYKATPNHRCLARLNDKYKDWHCVYLMRKGGLFRVGETVLFRKNEQNFGLGLRARQERADAMWLLKASETKEEALAFEAIVSSVYGIPDLCFVNSGDLAISQERLDGCWGEIASRIGDFKERAITLLDHHGRDFRFPIWKKNSKEQLAVSRQCLVRACNLEPMIFEVPVVKDDDVEWHEIDTRTEFYEGIVHSLEVEAVESTNFKGLYIANGIVTGNSIYAFRGAHQASMRLLEESFNMRKLVLSVSFRCPRRVVEEARWRAPHMQYPEWASEGTVTSLESWSIETLSNTATIICRNNAPIFSLAIRLLRNGRYPEIVGNDLGKNLIKTLKKFGKPSLSQNLVFDMIDAWEKDKLRKSRNEGKVHDTANCLRIFAEQGKNLGDAIAYAEHIMNATGPVKMLTVHKAKGLEWPDVFILDKHLIKLERDEQERNLFYVAQTRAKSNLFYIESEGFEEVVKETEVEA